MPVSPKFKKAFVILIFISLAAIFWLSLFLLDFSHRQKTIYGVTFSQKYANELGLDWQKTYLAILDDLKVKNLRLVAYWDQIEGSIDNFNFTDLDWQINQAASRGTAITLAVGRRVPRWPECHDPVWLKNLAPLAVSEHELNFVKTVIERYKGNSAIKFWQIENEPLLRWFGECPKPSRAFLEQEINLAKSLDSRPIIITDSGELSSWQAAGGLADILGTTLYRIVWNPYSGFWDYFFVPPAFYHYKAEITKFFHKNLKAVIVTELQMEPWTMGKPMAELSLADQQKSFDLKRFKDNVNYVTRAGFSEVYLWGVEYWYWLKEKGHPEIWQEAEKLWP
ncbi:MAG: hypothetical protein WC768_01095 [Patescibacteria group bacterium]|jgi:hypothetical protein